MMTTITSFICKFWRSITLVTLALITVTSLLPAEHLPAAPGSDKTHHFIAYCALMLPTALRRPRYWFALALLFIIWSGLIEIIQPYVNRYGEWLDLLANTGGIVLAIIIAQGIHWTISKQKDK
ncbi:VanZ family protein [Colwellia sp. Arc7-635]|uniref:VanZ family protein n=1 Tax=Colwellia sp. Arc7-635 TaxID=2497879 RepID=UPI001F494592|nr:VanZ family protein [Colwellia sp. Arc7-635]